LMLIEVQSPAQSTLLSPDTLDWQTVEISADDAAARFVMGNFVKRDIPSDASIPDPKHRLFLWSFALYAMFRYWGLEIDSQTSLTDDHPPSALRFETLIAGTCYEWVKDFPGIGDNYLAIVHNAQMAVEQAIAFCGGKRLTASDIIAIGDCRIQDHMEKLYSHHDVVLMPELMNLAHIQLRALEK